MSDKKTGNRTRGGRAARDGRRISTAATFASSPGSVIERGLNDLATNETRQSLVTELGSMLEQLKAEGRLENVVGGEVFGSFVSSKERPSDIDIVFRVNGPLSNSQEVWNTTQVFEQNQQIMPRRTRNLEIIFVPSRGQYSEWPEMLRKGTQERYGVQTRVVFGEM